MIALLALRHLVVRRARSLVLLAGFALGVGVMITLLSVGEAMVEQARDVALVGGGEVTVLPQGIDLEALRTGGLSSMFFGIDRARFLTRQAVGGARHADVVAEVSPGIDGKLLFVSARGRSEPVRATGEIPSRARRLDSGVDVVAGAWADSPADSAWIAPSATALYDELDRFHLPPRADSTWGEWQYYNVLVSPHEWWYVTYLVGGAVGHGRWGGQLLVTRRRPDGVHERYVLEEPATRVRLDTASAALAIGDATVRQADGTWTLRGRARGPAGTATLDLEVRAVPDRLFPPVELASDDFVSGYVVPALRAEATGTLCAGGRCVRLERAPAYHDHNWGTWRDVSWEWGAGRGNAFDVLYGGVARAGRAAGGAPYFLALVDSLGVRQVLRFREMRHEGRRPVPGEPVAAPARFALVAARDADTVRLTATVRAAHATRVRAEGMSRFFLQLRADYILEGRVGGNPLAEAGQGFFETYVDGGR